MTTTYDPDDPAYFDEADLRVELERVFDLCHGCRLCFNLCPSFPTLFDFVDANDGDVSALTPAEQDQVVDECYQCKLCYLKCPYVPPHEWQLDFPRLMMRAHAVRHADGSARPRAGDRPGPRAAPTCSGRVSTAAAPVVNAVTGTPGSLARRVMEKTVGHGRASACCPPTPGRASRPGSDGAAPAGAAAFAPAPAQGEVSVFPTCFVEYMEPGHRPGPGQGLRAQRGLVLAARGRRAAAARRGCTRATSSEFSKAARRNVAALAAEVRAGRDVVVAQPTCAYVVKRDYPLYLGHRRGRGWWPSTPPTPPST